MGVVIDDGENKKVFLVNFIPLKGVGQIRAKIYASLLGPNSIKAMSLPKNSHGFPNKRSCRISNPSSHQRQSSQTGYNVLAHLKKIRALLSVYEALKISEEMRESLTEVLSNPNDYQDDMGPPNTVACLATINRQGEIAKVNGHN